MEKTRIYLFDNLKALLILFVVFGHLLESLLQTSDYAKLLYLLIYSFHIPLFAFCSGYFACFHVSRIKRTLIYPFLLFQTFYLLFDRFYLQQDTLATFTKPYWLMWYLFALIIWEIALPFIETANPRKQLLTIGGAFFLSVLAGYDNSIGYYMSLSRIIVYFPFFLMAHYMRTNHLFDEIKDFAKSWTGRGLSLISALGMTACIIWQQDVYRVSWLYGSRSYETGRYSAMERIQFTLFAVMWIVFLIGLIPDRKTCYTKIGQNSLVIYLLHGFMIKILFQMKFYQYLDDSLKIPTAFLLSVLMVLLLSSRPAARLTKPLMRLP